MIFSKNKKYKKALVIVSFILFAGFLGLQMISPEVSNPPVTGKFKGPQEVTQILERACYDCHSNETSLAWYDKVAPFSFKVAADVEEARKRFNFSEWDSIPGGEKETRLWHIVNMVDAGRMPLKSYMTFHPSARVTEKELTILKNYVTQLSERNHAVGDTFEIKKAVVRVVKTKPENAHDVPESLNGIRYFEDYKNWKVISSTNRFDNGTMRLIYGNDITVKAIEENKINPWPNGAVIVKVVWNNQPEDKDGNVKPGNFNNVQLMIRDDKKFKDTEGWGFARFNGLDLVPYGKTVSFATSCINCHQLASKSGFVFDMPTKNEAVKH